MKKSRWHVLLANFPFGVLVGCLIAFSIAWLLEEQVEDSIRKFYTYFASALFSLIAATLAVTSVLYSVQNQTNLALYAREQKLRSARAMLPAALSDLSDIAERALDWTQSEAVAQVGTDSRYSENIDLSIEPATIEVIRQIIEHTDDERVSRHLAGIVTEHQVFRSRFQGEWRVGSLRPVSGQGIGGRAIEWAAWKCLVDTTYHYARGASATIKRDVTEEMILSVLPSHQLEGSVDERAAMLANVYAGSFQKKGY